MKAQKDSGITVNLQLILQEVIFTLHTPSHRYYTWKREENIVRQSRSTSVNYGNEKRLKSITFNGGSVDFNVSNEQRKDPRNKKLESIIVKDKDGVQVKKVSFNYDYFISKATNTTVKEKSHYRLKLTGINIYGKTNANPLPYRFTYNEKNILPPYNQQYAGEGYAVTDYSHWGQDFWGYYNGVKTNKHMIGILPEDADERIVRNKANRNPSEEYTKACILERVDYPTGGYTLFEMEANKDENGKLYGGLRIAKMILKESETAPEIINSFSYEQMDKIYEPSPEYYYYRDYHRILDTEEKFIPNIYYSGNPIQPMGNYQGSPVTYKKVTKYESYDEGNTNGKMVYTYRGAVMPGKQNFYGRSPNIKYISRTPTSWLMGQPLKEEYFKEKNGFYIPVREVVNEYKEYPQLWYNSIIGSIPYFPIELNTSLRYFWYHYTLHPNGIHFGSTQHATDYFEIIWSYENTGSYKLVKTTDRTYNDSGIYTDQITEYAYDNIGENIPQNQKNLFLTKKTQANSNGHKYIELYKYPQNYLSTGIYNDMATNKNMLSSPIEIINYKNSIAAASELSRKKTNYSYFKTTKIYPSSYQTSILGQPDMTTEISFSSYDSYGNILQYTTIDNKNTVLLWSYNGQYPIAEIKGATYEQVRDALGGESEVQRISNSISLSVSDSTKISSLRHNPSLSNALVTTYTYKPLVGMSTATDARGVTTHYEYDSFGRLKDVYIEELDSFGRKVRRKAQSYDYHYQNQ